MVARVKTAPKQKQKNEVLSLRIIQRVAASRYALNFPLVPHPELRHNGTIQP